MYSGIESALGVVGEASVGVADAGCTSNAVVNVDMDAAVIGSGMSSRSMSIESNADNGTETVVFRSSGAGFASNGFFTSEATFMITSKLEASSAVGSRYR